MKLTKMMQYGLLLCLYVSRGGRITLGAASESLNIPITFLEQIARRLRISGILRSVRGPGGGYELSDGVTVGSVLKALGPINLLESKDKITYLHGTQEQKTFYNLVCSMEDIMYTILNRKIINLCNEYALNQMKQLNGPSPSSKRN